MYSLNPIYHLDYDRSQHQPRPGSIESHRRPRLLSLNFLVFVVL